MLKLKSVVKTREQLLATGWVEDEEGYFNHPPNKITLHPQMCEGIYHGIVTEKIETKLIGTRHTISWEVYPEMVLLLDQWGFVRDPETLEILMWDAVRGGATVIKEIDLTVDYPILGVPIDLMESYRYTKSGLFYTTHTSASLSKYPYSLQHGGYTPFDFEELMGALQCEKNTPLATPSDTGDSTKSDLPTSAMMSESKGHVEVTTEAKMKDEANPPVTLGDQEMYRVHFVSTTIRELTESMRYLDGDVKKMVEQKIAELLKSI